MTKQERENIIKWLDVSFFIVVIGFFFLSREFDVVSKNCEVSPSYRFERLGHSVIMLIIAIVSRLSRRTKPSLVIVGFLTVSLFMEVFGINYKYLAWGNIFVASCLICLFYTRRVV